MSSPRSNAFGLLPAILAGAAAGAAAAAATTWVLSRAEPLDPAGPPVVVTPRLDEIDSRLDRLERGLAANPAPARAAPPGLGRTPAEARDGDPIEQRLAEIEETVARLRQAAVAPGSIATRAPQAEAEDPVARARRILRQHDVILSPTSDARQKLEAWRELRHEVDAYTDAVVAKMTQLGLASAEAEVRADVWRQADGRTQHDALVPALLQAVRMDPDRRVREEAAETLVEYAARPEVAATLQRLLPSEEDEGVRRYLEAGLEQARRADGQGR